MEKKTGNWVLSSGLRVKGLRFGRVDTKDPVRPLQDVWPQAPSCGFLGSGFLVSHHIKSDLIPLLMASFSI